VKTGRASAWAGKACNTCILYNKLVEQCKIWSNSKIFLSISWRNRRRRKVQPRDAAPLMINQALSRKQTKLSELCYVVYEIKKDGAEMLIRKIGQSVIAIAVTGRDIKLVLAINWQGLGDPMITDID
jgi:hypothetical protein